MTRFFACTLLAFATIVSAAEPTPTTGTIRFDPLDGAPDRFQLAPHTFDYTLAPKYQLPHSGVDVYTLTFPSPIVSPHPENNVVHAEYFVPRGRKQLPAVIVLDILDGKQIVSRGEAMWLAQNDIAALVVYMAYYGPRRPPESTAGRIRMLSPNVDRSVAAVTQTVLDCRRAAAWLASRPEVDANRLGIVGTSLGSFISGLVAAAEPRVKCACLLLGGGGLVDAFTQHPKAAGFVKLYELLGGTKATLKAIIDPIDPLTYADRLKTKRLLLIGASRDDVVPPVALRTLWNATGRPNILWLDATHVGAVAYAFPAMSAVIRHVKNESSP